MKHMQLKTASKTLKLDKGRLSIPFDLLMECKPLKQLIRSVLLLMVCQRVLMSSPWKHTVYINSTQRKGSKFKCPVQSGCGFRTHFNLISLSQLTSNCCSFTPLTDFDRARGHTSELQQQCKACGKIFD